MTFARTELLYWIWILPLLAMVVGYGLYRRQRILSAYADPTSIRAIAPATSRFRHGLKSVLALTAILFVLLALSGPRHGFRWEQVHRRGVDLMVVLDCSKSMLASDIAPTRLERAKREIVDLLNMMTGDRVGLVAFAGTAFVQCPLTLDYQAFHLFLSSLGPDFLPVGGTDLHGALISALDAFDPEAESDKAVILITDGENTGRDPMEAVASADQAGIKLFCIGVGKAGGAPIPAEGGGFQKDAAGKIVMSRFDETLLAKMAGGAGGRYVRSVSGDMDLESIYLKEIKAKMKSAELESGRRKVWEDRFQWALSLALLLLILEMLIPGVKKRLPILAIIVVAAMPAGTARAGWLNKDLHRGLDAYESGDYPKALKSFIDAQLQDPDRPEIDYNIGNAHYRIKDFESAARSFQDAARTEDRALKQKALYNLGNALFKSGDIPSAIKRYNQALELDPDDPSAQKNLEFAKKALNKKQEPPPDPSKDSSKPAPKDSPDDKKGEEKSPDGKGEKPPDNRQGASQRPDAGDPLPESGPEGQPGEDPAEKETRVGGDPEGTPSPGQDPSRTRAEQALNRLQDKPGRALMPAYQKRRVDKDW
jgi:Ca-activated chloride channel homolog